MSDPAETMVKPHRTYEYKAVASVGLASTESLKVLLDIEGAEGWLVTAVAGQYFILVRPSN